MKLNVVDGDLLDRSGDATRSALECEARTRR